MSLEYSYMEEMAQSDTPQVVIWKDRLCTPICNVY